MQSYKKTREMEKKKTFFFSISKCPTTSAKPKLHKNERSTKEKLAFLLYFRVPSTSALAADSRRIV